MTDPTLAYHHGNPESQAAWDSLDETSLDTLRAQVIDHIDSHGWHGATCDETEAGLDLSHQTCSARFTEAKARGQIIKRGDKRLTRSGRWAAVYIHPRYSNVHQLPTVVGAPTGPGITRPGGAGRDAAEPLATVPAPSTTNKQSGDNVSTQPSDGFDIGGEGGNSFPFNNPGDEVIGQVIDMTEVQQTDIDTNEPSFWPGGQPKMQYRVRLQTKLRDAGDPSDDGIRAVYLNGSRKSESKSKLAAVLGAVRQATGGTQLAPGGWLALKYDGDGQRTRPGFNPPKLYSARYSAPSNDKANDLAASTPPPAAAPVAAGSNEPPF